MRCWCAMSKDRDCPAECKVGAYATMSPSDQKARRKPLAEELYRNGMSMEQIAAELSVSHQTIGRDLEEFVHDGQTQPRTSKRGRKSEGRPKGSKSKRESRRGEIPAPITKQAREIVRPLITSHQAVNRKDLKKEHGISENVFQLATAMEEARQETLEEKTALDPGILSKTAQEKLEIAIRQYKRKLDAEFEIRTREDVQRWLNEVSLPQYTKQLAKLERSITSRKGVMDRITYRKILSCLHPDRVTDPILKKRYEEAFRLFTELEKRVLDEKESPTTFRKMPRTYEELMAMKAKVKAERRAKRTAMMRR